MKIVLGIFILLCVAGGIATGCGSKNEASYPSSYAPLPESRNQRRGDVSRICNAGIQHARDRGNANLRNLIRTRLPLDLVFRIGMDRVQYILENECY